MNISSFKVAVLMFFLSSFGVKAQVVINEIMPSNQSTKIDEDGDYSDWFELFNSQDSLVNLSGFGISDDDDELYKWVIPDITISPREHLLIFASDKDRTNYINHWETIITWGDDWKYFVGSTAPPSSWRDKAFNDGSWPEGSSGFGYGDDDDSTIVPQVVSVFVRKTFSIYNINEISAAVLHIDYDDAFVAYLNSVEIARSNIGTPNIIPAYNQSADNALEASIYLGGKPQTFLIENIGDLLEEENVLSIEVHNYGTSSSDLTLIPFFSLGMNATPQDSKGTHPLLELPFQNLHTNFKLDAEGEDLFLTDNNGNIVDSVFTGRLSADISFGRQPDGSENWFSFSESTPGDSNITQGFSGVADEPVFSVEGGFHSSSFLVSISADPGNVIRYTLDGSNPVESSTLYNQPINITETKILRARCFSPGFLPGKTVTKSYFLNFNTSLPVFSISTDPANFFDEETGIYTLGDSAESADPHFGANFWKDWEKPIHIDFFDKDNSGFSIDAGVKIYGAWSRARPQKSLAFFARGGYGYSEINYPLFPDLPFTSYQSFILRNSGNDWNYTMFRDALLQKLLDGVDVDKQAYRPAVLFLNGDYWGILNLREKINEDFIAAHHNVDRDSIDILENNGVIVAGDSSDYMELYDYILNNNLSVTSNYQYVQSKIDINNFIAYFASQIYFDNRDWPGNNIKFWKKKRAGKWRWIMFDTDFGFGLYNNSAYSDNTLNFALEPNGPDWPNPPWSTLFLRKLLENQSFKNDFINGIADLLNNNFLPANVVKHIDIMKDAIAPEISSHILQWHPFSENGWNYNVSNLITFANQRPGYFRLHLTQKFGLPGNATVNVTISDTAMGSVKLNSINIKVPSWSGIYFQTVPIKLIAKPESGYRFVKWEGSYTSSEDSIIVAVSGTFNMNAVFEIDSNYSAPNIVINEINYNSSSDFDTEDWVELYNNSTTPADISGWIFKDSDDDHSFIFPDGTISGGEEYLVLCIDTNLFTPLFPDVSKYIGNVDFGLSGGGELIRLFHADSAIVDSLTFGDRDPWPDEADGNGATLALLNPDLDNHLPENWAASFEHGTPGKMNDVFVNAKEEKNILPTKFSLYQNYPNPFNPVTKISWQSPVSSWQTLKIYDVLGREIKTLVDEYRPAGNYEVEFDAAGLASGIYYYRLSAGDFAEVKKMIIMK